MVNMMYKSMLNVLLKVLLCPAKSPALAESRTLFFHLAGHSRTMAAMIQVI